MRLATPLLRRLPILTAIALNAIVVSACGGGGNAGSGGDVLVPVPPPVPLRGSLIGSATLVPVSIGGASVATVTPAALGQLLEAAQRGSTLLTGTPSCAVTTYTVRYHTVGGAGEDTDASAAIMLPSGGGADCSGSRPVLLYAHGTSVLKSTDMANLGATEPRLIAAMFAAQGYIVVAPNYAGYAGSALAYHAYLDAEQQSADMIDALRAARLSFAALGASAGGRLYVSGYSQGGYVALATQRAMQTRHAGEFQPTAAAGLSGPYALAQTGDAIFNGAPTQGAAAFLPLLINAAQRANAGIYASPADVYESRYAAGIDSLLPGSLSIGELVAAGKLPNDVLFAQDSLPQAAGYGAAFGPEHLIRSSYRDSYLADLRAHPCDVAGASPLSCAPTQLLRKWLVKNDLRTYVPVPPLLLCGGNEDPVVPFQNTVSTSAYFGALGKPAGSLSTLDVDGRLALGDPYLQVVRDFAAAKAAVRVEAFANGGNAAAADLAVRNSYHAGLVAPFCLRAARQFFNATR